MDAEKGDCIYAVISGTADKMYAFPRPAAGS